MAADNDWADGSELAGISRSGNVLQQLGYDPDEARGNPAMRAEIMGKLSSPYALTGGQGTPVQRAAALPGQVSQAMRQAPPQAPAAPTPPSQTSGQTSAQTSPNGKTTPQSMAGGAHLDQIGAEALNRGMRLGGFAEDTAREMAASPGPDTDALEAQRAKDALPTPYRDPNTGKVLESAKEAGYKPGIWSEIGRGVRGALVGGLTGGIPGALVGAIEPQDIRGGTGYEAPDKAYQATEATRQARLGSEDQQIENAGAKFKAMTDARAKAAQEARQGVTAYNDVAERAANLENANTNMSKNDTQLRKAGFKTDDKGNIVPLDRSEMSPTQQAMTDLSAAREEEAEATAALRTAQNDPNSPAYKLAESRVEVARQNAQTAIQRLGLSSEEFEMHSRGTAGGVALPGAMELPDGTPVGTAFQGNVRPTGTQRDAAGRATTMSAISERIQQGLNDPEIQAYLGPAAGRFFGEGGAALGVLPEKVAKFRNDLVSYGAFQAGLHPVRGIGALHYFDKVMGGMGQTPDSLRGKLASNQDTGQSVQGVGQPKVAGGTPVTSPQVAPAGGNWASQYPEAQ